jgi:hypothetical protein
MRLNFRSYTIRVGTPIRDRGALKHLVDRAVAAAHHIAIQHHIRQPPVTLKRLIQRILHNRLAFSGYAARIAVARAHYAHSLSSSAPPSDSTHWDANRARHTTINEQRNVRFRLKQHSQDV